MAARSAHEHPCALDPCGRSRRLATAGVAHARRLQSLARTNWAHRTDAASRPRPLRRGSTVTPALRSCCSTAWSRPACTGVGPTPPSPADIASSYPTSSDSDALLAHLPDTGPTTTCVRCWPVWKSSTCPSPTPYLQAGTCAWSELEVPTVPDGSGRRAAAFWCKSAVSIGASSSVSARLSVRSGGRHSGEAMTNLAKDGPEWPASRPAAWAAAARAARERLRGTSTAVTPPAREGAMSPAERRAYWRRLDAEIEERQRIAREERARRGSGC